MPFQTTHGLGSLGEMGVNVLEMGLRSIPQVFVTESSVTPELEGDGRNGPTWSKLSIVEENNLFKGGDV